MRHALLPALLGVIALAGCGGDDTSDRDAKTAAPAAATAEAAPAKAISIADFLFEPASATVKAGQRIAVRNTDAAPHTLTDKPSSGRPLFDTGNVTGRQSGSFVAPKPGTYEYFCELHAFMKGKLTVVS